MHSAVYSVHDNEEIYPLAKVIYDIPGAVTIPARSELGGPAGKAPAEWTRRQRSLLREKAKLLVTVRAAGHRGMRARGEES